MREHLKFYIGGQWVDPVELKTLDVINPANEQIAGKIALGSAADVDRAVKAARKDLKLEKPFHVGLNYWYLAPTGKSTAVLKVRHGTVEEIGIGDKQLTRSKRLMTSPARELTAQREIGKYHLVARPRHFPHRPLSAGFGPSVALAYF